MRQSPRQELVVGPEGTLWVADPNAFSIYHFSPTGQWIGHIGGSPGKPGELGSPESVAVPLRAAASSPLAESRWTRNRMCSSPILSTTGSWSSRRVATSYIMEGLPLLAFDKIGSIAVRADGS